MLPKTTLDKNQYDEFKNNGLIMLKTNNGMTCHYSGKVCSHEIPRGIKVKRKNNYFYLY